jgi:hypothetical protein
MSKFKKKITGLLKKSKGKIKKFFPKKNYLKNCIQLDHIPPGQWAGFLYK